MIEVAAINKKFKIKKNETSLGSFFICFQTLCAHIHQPKEDIIERVERERKKEKKIERVRSIKRVWSG